MQKEIRNEIRQFKTARKNEQLFGRTAVVNPNFLNSLIALTKNYSPLKSEIPNAEELDARTRFFSREAIISCGRRAVYSLEHAKRSAFFEAINLVMQEGAFGEEWRETFITLAMVGILCPPIFNLSITEPTAGMVYSEPLGKHRTILVLNPDTSLKDIKNAWPEIEKIQRSSWPKFKGFNMTKTSPKRLMNQLNAMIAKNSPIQDKEKYKAIGSLYETYLLKQGGGTEAVAKYRSKLKLHERQSSQKSIKIKRKTTDADLIRQAQPNITKLALKRAVDRFRQERSRLLKR